VVTSLNTGACAALTGCAPTVLADFQLTFNQCSITKVGPTVTVSRPGVDPIAADFDGDVVDRASLSGASLVISLRGRVVSDQFDITINKDTGVVTSAAGSAKTDGVTRTIDCAVKASGGFPATAAVSSITTVAELVKALDPRTCLGIADGVNFTSCGSTSVPDFSIKVGVCTLSKAGDVLSVSKPGTDPISAKLNGELLDGMAETGASNGVYFISLMATDSDLTTGTQIVGLRVLQPAMTATVSASDLRKTGSRFLAC
jgi:hypothetical protein